MKILLSRTKHFGATVLDGRGGNIFHEQDEAWAPALDGHTPVVNHFYLYRRLRPFILVLRTDPTYVVLPPGAHPSVSKFLALNRWEKGMDGTEERVYLRRSQQEFLEVTSQNECRAAGYPLRAPQKETQPKYKRLTTFSNGAKERK